jgi:hypothetical protein
MAGQSSGTGQGVRGTRRTEEKEQGQRMQSVQDLSSPNNKLTGQQKQEKGKAS